MKVRMSGDICHPGIIELEVESLEDAKRLFDGDGLSDEETGFTVHDESSDCLWFIPDGNLYDENGDPIGEEENDNE